MFTSGCWNGDVTVRDFIVRSYTYDDGVFGAYTDDIIHFMYDKYCEEYHGLLACRRSGLCESDRFLPLRGFFISA